MKPAWNYNPDPVNGRITLYTPKSYQVFANHPRFAHAFEAYRVNDVEAFINIADPTAYIKSLYAKYESIEVRDGNVYVDGTAINNLVAEHILDFLSKGIDCFPIFKFVIKLQNNPSKRAVDEAYTWLANRSFGITDTGNILGYKAVRNNFLDIYSGTFDNNVGQVHSMPRNTVDDNKENGCSYGFHVGTQDYATGFCPQGGHIMAVEFDPADIVSVPSDCNYQKLRVCRYMVVEELEGIMDDIYKSRLASSNDSLFDSWDDEDCTDDNTYCDYCSEVSESVCDECQCCCECCECPRCNNCSCVDTNLSDKILCSDCESSDEGGCMGDPDDDEPKKEMQLELNLDNKIQSFDWTKSYVKFVDLINHLFASRRPALAISMRRELKDYNEYTFIEYGVLLHHTTETDAQTIYKELNP
jgi:hypothetical protein